MNYIAFSKNALRPLFLLALLSPLLSAYAAEQIHDIKLPPVDNSFELPAIGWWFVGIALLATIFLIGFLLWKAFKQQQIRRLAKQEIANIDCQHPEALTQINQIIKRVCLHYFPREFVAALSGEQWRLFLQNHQNKLIADKAWFHLQYQPFDAQKHPQQSAQFQQFALSFLSQSFPPKRRSTKVSPVKKEATNA